MAGEHDTNVSPKVRARDDVVFDADHLEMCDRPETLFNQVGEQVLIVTRRSDVDELCRLVQ